MKDPLAMLEEADEEEDKQQEETEIIDKVSDGQSDVVFWRRHSVRRLVLSVIKSKQ